MFDSGVPQDQFHQFIVSRNPVPHPLAFPLHGVASSVAPQPPPSFPGCFDPYSQTLSPPPPPHQPQQSGLLQLYLQRQQQQSTRSKINDEEKEEATSQLLSSTNLRHDQRERSISNHHPIDDLWSNDEVLALLRIRSSFENWFPEFTWAHVSRKLSELGFQRSAEKCKEKFEEESRQFNNMNYNKTYRFFSELDELYQGENPPVVPAEKIQNLEKENDKEDEGDEMEDPNPVEDAENNIVAVASASEEINEELVIKPMTKRKKRKRKEEFEMIKGFCEALVKKLMAQQEELNNKIVQDVIKREEENIAREEAWKRQEIERINKEKEIRSWERAIEGDRQEKIIEFLKKFASDSSDNQNLKSWIDDFLKVTNSSTSATSSSEFLPHNYINTPCQQQSSDQSKLETATSSSMVMSRPNPTTFLLSQKDINLPTSSSETPSPHNHSSTPKPASSSMASQNPNDATHQVQANPLASSPQSSVLKLNQKMNSATNERGDGDIGKRWPRDEVLALINLRRSLNYNNNNNEDNKEAAKGPLWERISQRMLELGYKRSAKRCKEKWENINKYFRKTKDNKKKRSMDSRTCPYFDQLSSLYSQGPPDAAPSDLPENRQISPENI